MGKGHRVKLPRAMLAPVGTSRTDLGNWVGAAMFLLALAVAVGSFILFVVMLFS